MSWGVDSGVATTEAMKRERHREENIVSVEEAIVRNQVGAACPRNIPFMPNPVFAFVCPLWLTLPLP